MEWLKWIWNGVTFFVPKRSDFQKEYQLEREEIRKDIGFSSEHWEKLNDWMQEQHDRLTKTLEGVEKQLKEARDEAIKCRQDHALSEIDRNLLKARITSLETNETELKTRIWELEQRIQMRKTDV